VPNFPGRYQFVIQVPADAGEALGAVVISPRDHATSIRFNLAASSARQGRLYARGPELALANVGGSDIAPSEVVIVFEEPLQPGETATITHRTHRNPSGDVYLFGVTAFPAEESSMGQFLGYGRIHIYDQNN
jgi:hypothetical protein